MIDVVKNNYDVYSSQIQGPMLSCDIVETKPNAKFRCLSVHNSNKAKMYFFPTEYIESIERTTTKVSTKLQDSNCDGTIFLYAEDATMHIIMCELKSCQPGARLSDAFKQLVYSFLKYYSLFSICEGWHIANYSLDLVLACSCAKNHKDLEAEMLSAQNDLDTLGEGEGPQDFSVGIFTKLYLAKNHTLQLSFSDLRMLEDFKLNEHIKNKSFALHLATTANFGEDNAQITFDY